VAMSVSTQAISEGTRLDDRELLDSQRNRDRVLPCPLPLLTGTVSAGARLNSR
jgi:hypothetical protein